MLFEVSAEYSCPSSDMEKDVMLSCGSSTRASGFQPSFVGEWCEIPLECTIDSSQRAAECAERRTKPRNRKQANRMARFFQAHGYRVHAAYHPFDNMQLKPVAQRQKKKNSIESSDHSTKRRTTPRHIKLPRSCSNCRSPPDEFGF